MHIELTPLIAKVCQRVLANETTWVSKVRAVILYSLKNKGKNQDIWYVSQRNSALTHHFALGSTCNILCCRI